MDTLPWQSKASKRQLQKGERTKTCSKSCQVHCEPGRDPSACTDSSLKDTFESMKRRFQKQNNEIIRINTVRSMQYRKCECDRLQLVAENLELRKQLSGFKEQLLDEERKIKLVENVEVFIENSNRTISKLVDQLRMASDSLESNAAALADGFAADVDSDVELGISGDLNEQIGKTQRLVMKYLNEPPANAKTLPMKNSDKRKRRQQGRSNAERFDDADGTLPSSLLATICEETSVQTTTQCPSPTPSPIRHGYPIEEIKSAESHLACVLTNARHSPVRSENCLPFSSPSRAIPNMDQNSRLAEMGKGRSQEDRFTFRNTRMEASRTTDDCLGITSSNLKGSDAMWSSDATVPSTSTDPFELTDEDSIKHVQSRPLRRNTNVNYALPNVRSKLRQGDEHTFGLPPKIIGPRTKPR